MTLTLKIIVYSRPIWQIWLQDMIMVISYPVLC